MHIIILFVFPIFKGNLFPGPFFLSSYHSISLLPFLENPLESISCTHGFQSFSSNSLLNPLQSGFCPYHSIKMSLNQVTSDFQVAKSNDHSSILILLDLSTAPSTVDHPSSWEYSTKTPHSPGSPSSRAVPSQPAGSSSSSSF